MAIPSTVGSALESFASAGREKKIPLLLKESLLRRGRKKKDLVVRGHENGKGVHGEIDYKKKGTSPHLERRE